MVDRLEELLAQMADEDDGEQEDALALEAERTAPAVPAPERSEEAVSEGKQRDAEPGESWTGPEYETALSLAEKGAAQAAAFRDGGEYPAEGDGPALEGTGSETLRALRAGSGQAAELGAGKRAAAETDGEAVSAAGTAAERGLEALYRRTAQASRPAAQSLPVEQAGRTVRAEEPGRIAALTVDELDRAVRRDSRRYDGGMSIF